MLEQTELQDSPEHQETQRTQNLAAALRISTRVSDSLNLDSILQNTCRAAVDLVNVDHCGLVLFSDDLQTGLVRAEYPALGSLGKTIPLSQVPAEQRLLTTKEPLLVPDVAAADDLGEVQGILKSLNIVTTLIVPVIAEGRLLGSFSLDSIGRPHTFTESDRELGLVLAAQASAAITNAKSYKTATENAARLEVLRRTNLATTSLGLDALLQVIIASAVSLLRVASGGIYEYDDQKQQLILLADHKNPQNKGDRLKVGEGLAGRLVLSTEPYMIVTNYEAWPERATTLAAARTFGAVLEVRLMWQDRCLGVLYVNDAVGRQFTAEDARWLRLYADQAAIALVNARLMASEKGKIKRLEQLAQATRVLMGDLSARSLDDQMNLIARYVAEVLRAEVCGVFRVMRKGFLALEAGFGQNPQTFRRGQEFRITDDPHGGLTGYIAHTGRLFNASGENLVQHPAATGAAPDHLPSGQCYSLLAVPLKHNRGQSEELIGLLKAENKRDEQGRASPALSFTQEDEWLLSIFGEIVAVAVDNTVVFDESRRQQAQFNRLIAASPVGIVANDLEGNVTIFSQRAEQILNYQAYEMMHQPVERLFVDPHDADLLGDRLRQSAEGVVNDYETLARSKTGEPIPIRVSVARLYDSHDVWSGTVGYFEDLRGLREAQHQAEVLLKASRLLGQAGDLAQGLQELAGLLVESLPISFCRVLIRNGDARTFTVLAGYPAVRSQALVWKPRLQRKLTAEARPCLAALLDAPSKAGELPPRQLRWSDLPDRPELLAVSAELELEREVHSLLIIPLVVGDQLVGAFEFGEVRDESRHIFEDATSSLAKAVATQTAVLIDRRHVAETTARRERLLEALDEASRLIRADREMPKLLHEIVRLSVLNLMEGDAGLLLTNRPQLKELEVTAVYNLPTSLIGQVQSHRTGLSGQVAVRGEPLTCEDFASWPNREPWLEPYGLSAVLALPLKQGADVDSVLVVANRAGGRQFDAVDLDILQRFALQAAPARQLAGLVGHKEHVYQHLITLQALSNYFQTTTVLARIVHAALTSITAGYGLGFNRAALFLLNDTGVSLQGQEGIGGLVEAQVRKDWQQHIRDGREDVQHYLALLEQDQLVATPISERVRSLCLALDPNRTDLFTAAIYEKRHQVVDHALKIAELPQSFQVAFEPATPLVVVPLAARGQMIGLLVADNKFTHSPITPELLETLLAYANTIALAIQNLNLIETARVTEEQLSSLYTASNDVNATRDPDRLLGDCVERVAKVAEAAGVSMVLIDPLAEIKQVITWGIDQPAAQGLVRPNGLSMKIMRTGKPEIIANTYAEAERERVNPSVFERGIVTAIGLPLITDGEPIGVMWLHYNQVRPIRSNEVANLQLYVNQAASAYARARRLKELEHLRLAAEKLAGTVSLPETLGTTATSACEVLQAASAVIWSYDEPSGAFVLNDSVAVGFQPKTWEEFRQKGPRRGGTADTVLARGWVGVSDIDNTRAHPFLGESTRSLLKQVGAKSFQGLALKSAGENLGVLYVNYNFRRNFSPDEIETARTFANLAASALRNARSKEQSAGSRQAAEAIARSVITATDHKSRLQSIVYETRSIMDCAAVVLYAYDAETGQLGHPPTMIGLQYPERAMHDGAVDANSIVYTLLARDDVYQVEDAEEDELFRERRFRKEEGIVSVLAVPLRALGKKVGLMFINYRQPHHFSDSELKYVAWFGNQAALAIDTGRLVEATAQQARQLKAIVDLSQQVRASQNLDEVLVAGCRTAVQQLGIDHAGVVLFEPNRQTGKVHAEFPAAGARGVVIQLQGVPAEARLIETGLPQIFVDALAEEGLRQVRDILEKIGTRSLALVPIWVKNELIGSFGLDVIGRTRRFSDEDIELAQVLAAQVGVAIENSGLYQELSVRLAELERTQNMLSSRTALAHMGMAYSVWWHSMRAHATNIRNGLILLRQDFEYLDVHVPAEAQQIFEKHLDMIEDQTKGILDKPITPPLGSEASMETIRVNDLIQERVGQLMEHDEFDGVAVDCQWESADLWVRISPAWFCRALDVVMNNAAHAMRNQPIRQIHIHTHPQGGLVEITIHDTGPGIDPQILPLLLKEPIDNSAADSKGQGTGLLLAQIIMQAYSGDISFDPQCPLGATFRLNMPLADPAD